MSDVGYEAEIDELSQQVKVFVAETKQQMEVFVAEAKKAASIAGKPLLVVYGEDHMSEHDLIAQAILLKIASEQGLKDLCLELNETHLSFTRGLSVDKRRMNMHFTVAMAECLGMTVIPVDKTATESSCEGNTSPEGIERRDKDMIKNMLGVGRDAFLQTGAAHLRSFATSNTLAEKYHVVSTALEETADLKITNASIKKRLDFIKTSEKVTRLPSPGNLEGIEISFFFAGLLGDKFERFSFPPALFKSAARETSAHRPISGAEPNDRPIPSWIGVTETPRLAC